MGVCVVLLVGVVSVGAPDWASGRLGLSVTAKRAVAPAADGAVSTASSESPLTLPPGTSACSMLLLGSSRWSTNSGSTALTARTFCSAEFTVALESPSRCNVSCTPSLLVDPSKETALALTSLLAGEGAASLFDTSSIVDVSGRSAPRISSISKACLSECATSLDSSSLD